MSKPCLLSDTDLLNRMPPLVRAERGASADVLEHLVEVDRRRLYLAQACGSLNAYCERLGYSEDEAFKRVRVARAAHSVPRVLDELRSGAIHLTGLFVLAPYLNEQNAGALFAEARGKSRSDIELTLARWFPKPDASPKVVPLGEAGAGGVPDPATGPSGPSEQRRRPGTVGSERPRVEPLSAERYRIEFTASAEFHAKLEKAKQLLSHTLPGGDLEQLFERALDELIDREVKRRMGAGKPRKRRTLRIGSRHVPLEVARQVWERDGAQCSFVDAEGRRCRERRFLTLEHDQPFALSGQPTVENISLLCSAHNAHTARRVFGEAFIAEKRALRELSNQLEAQQASPLTDNDNFTKVQSALIKLGFRRQEASRAMNQLRQTQADAGLEVLLRAALRLLTPGRR